MARDTDAGNGPPDPRRNSVHPELRECRRRVRPLLSESSGFLLRPAHRVFEAFDSPMPHGLPRCFPRCGGVRGGGDWTVDVGASALAVGSIQFPLTPASFTHEAAEVKGEARRGAALPLAQRRPTPQPAHGSRLPRPRVSPAFFAPLRIRAMGHLAAVPRRSSRGSSCSSPPPSRNGRAIPSAATKRRAVLRANRRGSCSLGAGDVEIASGSSCANLSSPLRSRAGRGCGSCRREPCQRPSIKASSHRGSSSNRLTLQAPPVVIKGVVQTARLVWERV